MIAKITTYKGKIKWNKEKPDGTYQKLLDVSKLNNLGWNAKISLEEWIKLTYEDFKKDFNENNLRNNKFNSNLNKKDKICVPYLKIIFGSPHHLMVNIFCHEIEKTNLKLEKMHCKLLSLNNINNSQTVLKIYFSHNPLNLLLQSEFIFF